jgi:hypothetical protein
MKRQRSPLANRFRDARRAAATIARKRQGGQMLFPWFDGPAASPNRVSPVQQPRRDVGRLA